MRNYAFILFALLSCAALAAPGANKYLTPDADSGIINFYYQRGLSHRALGEKQEAIADFVQCLSMRPIAGAYCELGIYKYEDDDLQTAKRYFEESKKLDDNAGKPDYYLGLIYLRLHQFDSAESRLTQCINIDKTNANACLYLAMIKVKRHKNDEVPALLKVACLNTEDDWQLHLMIYDIYAEINDKENMLRQISIVISLGQTKSEYLDIRARLNQECGDIRAKDDVVYASEK